MSTLKSIFWGIIILVFLTMVSFACRLAPKHSVTPIQKTSGIPTANHQPADSILIQALPVGGKITVSVSKKARQKVYIQFANKNYTKLTAKLMPVDRNANIRFSQIFLPDRTMDGPFGQQFTYDIPKSGIYKLSIGESLMAGDPWAGSFKVTISLSN